MDLQMKQEERYMMAEASAGQLKPVFVVARLGPSGS